MSEAMNSHPACGECQAPMTLKTGKFGLFWGCTRWPDCSGIHGAHPNGKPLGIPADKATREARIRAHDAFDTFWKGHHWTRRRGYIWLQDTMQLSSDDAHIGRFTVDQCAQLIHAIQAAAE